MSSSFSSNSNLGIVVLSFNHPEITARAVHSALKLHQKIFLVHNGSEKKFITRLKNQFQNIVHLEIEKNRGYTGGVNFGLTHAFLECEWVILLTNDCLMQNLPEIPLKPAQVGPHILIQKTSRTDSLGGSFTPHLAKLTHCKTQKDFDEAKYKYIPGSAFLIHRDVFESTGKLDENLGTYWEDVDFSLRVVQQNQILLTDPNWLVEHSRCNTCHKHRHYTLYLYQRNLKRISYKYTKFIYKPFLFITLWTTWIKLAFRLILNARSDDFRLLLRAIKD